MHVPRAIEFAGWAVAASISAEASSVTALLNAGGAIPIARPVSAIRSTVIPHTAGGDGLLHSFIAVGRSVK